MNQNSDYYYDWRDYIGGLMTEKGLNIMQMAKACHCSKNTVKKWVRDGSVPINRETFLKIALGCRLTLRQANDLLQRYGKYPKLYVKNMEDAICTFILTHPEGGQDLYELFLQMKEYLLTKLRMPASPLSKRDTKTLENGILSRETTEEFENFILNNADFFQTSFQNPEEYLDLLICEKAENIHQFSSIYKLEENVQTVPS